ncbi:hypothetical protein MMC24_001753 [Lignoscripta atroalba]|nr:hypothetical protein [Lignoscripta atroalba]
MSTEPPPHTTESNISPLNLQTNPYKAQRLWPPDFSKIDTKHQFRLERRYRRRAKLKWARPGWTKAVKLAQWGSGIFVLGYGVLYMDWGTMETPFQGIRKWFHEQTASIWTTKSARPNLGRISAATTQNSSQATEPDK